MTEDSGVPKFSEAIDDATPLTGARIDVAARIGWLLRVHRTVAGVSLRQMSAALQEQGVSASASTLSRVESEGQRSEAILDGYARVLGLPDGVLRSIVNSLCRSFSYAPPAPPEMTTRSLESFSRSFEAVETPTPTAGAWLEFARQHAGGGGFGLPRSLMEPLVHQLSSEVGRGVASARFIRHEALSVLLTSAYGDVVDGVLRAAIEDPDHQNFYDLTSVIADRPSLDLLHWAGDLLRSRSTFHVRGATYVLQGMLVGGGLGPRDWVELVPHLERAWHEAGGDPVRTTLLAEVGGALPPPVQARLRDAKVVESTPPQPSVTWSLSRNNAHYAFAASIARTACARRGHGEEPLLARLLFESFFEPRGVRMALAAWVLAHSPFAGDLTHVIVEKREACPDQGTRTAALRVAALCHTGEDVPGVDALLDDPADFVHATTIIGRSGRSLPPEPLERGLAGDETTVRQTLYCLGMAGDARLPGIAADPSRASMTRRAAGWWVAQGSRILV